MKKPKKKLVQKLFGSSIILIIGLLILSYIFISLGKEYVRRYQVNKEIERLRAEVEKQESNNLKLVDLVDYLNSEQFIEKEARQKLGYKKPGENVVVIKEGSLVQNQPDANDQNSSEDKIAEEIKRSSNPIKWRIYFFGS